MLSCLILLRHHDNIQRLWRRREQNLDPREEEKNARAEVISSRLRQPGNSPALIAPFIRPLRLLAIKGDHRRLPPFGNNTLAAWKGKSCAGGWRRSATRSAAFSAAPEAADQDIDGKDYPGE